MSKYNLDKLVKVKVNDFYQSTWYVFKKGVPKQYFWQIEVKEGFYIDVVGLKYKGVSVPEGHFLRLGIVYEKPEVVMWYKGDVMTRKYFDTIEQAQSFSDELTIGKNWLLN